MHRQHLIELLAPYQPIDTSDKQARDTIVSFVNQHPECFERSLSTGHVTASAWLLNSRLDSVLLMLHTKLNRWLQPGGHCDGNPDVLAVAIKEAQEESGINAIVPLANSIFDLDVHIIPATAREAEHYHYDIRFALQAQDDTIAGNHESQAIRWFALNQPLPTVEPSILRMAHKWQLLDNSLLGHPYHERISSS